MRNWCYVDVVCRGFGLAISVGFATNFHEYARIKKRGFNHGFHGFSLIFSRKKAHRNKKRQDCITKIVWRLATQDAACDAVAGRLCWVDLFGLTGVGQKDTMDAVLKGES